MTQSFTTATAHELYRYWLVQAHMEPNDLLYTKRTRIYFKNLLNDADNPHVFKFLHDWFKEASLSEPEEIAQFADRYDSHVCTLLTIYPDLRAPIRALLYFGCSKGSGLCAHYLGEKLRGNLFGEPEPAHARELFEFAVINGGMMAYSSLADMLWKGEGGMVDEKRAFTYDLLAAITNGDYHAHFRLAEAFREGRGVERNLLASASLLKYSYDASETYFEGELAALRLAQMHLMANAADVGLGRDLIQALRMFQQAEIGLRLHMQEGVPGLEGYLEEALQGIRYVTELLEEEEQERW